MREQVQQLIATLRKALAQQKQLEASCERAKLPIEYRWSLNGVKIESENCTDSASAPEKPEVNHRKNGLETPSF